MKSMMKAKWVLLVIASFGMALAMAGDVSASPCIKVCFYSDPTCTETCGDDQPIDHNALVNGRLWYGTDSHLTGKQSVNMPEGPKNWSYRFYYDGPGANGVLNQYQFNGYWDYKVIVTGALQTTMPGTYQIQLISGIGDGLLTVGAQSQATVGGPNALDNVLYPELFKEADGLTTLDPSVKSRLEFAELMVTFASTSDIIPFSIMYHYFYDPANSNVYNPVTYPTDYTPDPNDRRPSGFDLRFKDATQSGIYFSHDCVPVPEPATMLLLGFGLVGLAGYGRKKFKG